MQNTEEAVHPDYLKGFNEGYVLANHMPEVAKEIGSIKPESPRMMGMQDGYKQFALEKVKEFTPSFLNPNRVQNVSQSKGKGFEKDNLEPDR
jgi:hypothetical protein